jgi:hypothetical protein
MPIVRVKYIEYKDTLYNGIGALNMDVRRYHYFRISRYGVIGNCAKYNYYDSAGMLVKTGISKISAMVCDGSAVHHGKIREFNNQGKLVKKTLTISKERGWAPSINREKIIEYGENGKRTIKHK